MMSHRRVRRKFHFCELGMATLGIAKPSLYSAGHCKCETFILIFYIAYGTFFFQEKKKTYRNTLHRINIHSNCLLSVFICKVFPCTLRGQPGEKFARKECIFVVYFL